MFTMKNYIFILIIALIFEGGCAPSSYNASPLTSLKPGFAPYSSRMKNITLSCKAFSKDDCRKYLDSDPISKGIQPIHITISNDSERYLAFSERNISLPVISAEEVFDQLNTYSKSKYVALGCFSMLFTPLIFLTIPEGFHAAEASKKLELDLRSKTIKKAIIQPYGNMNGIVFVSAPLYKGTFSVFLIDHETKEKYEFFANLLRGQNTASSISLERGTYSALAGKETIPSPGYLSNNIPSYPNARTISEDDCLNAGICHAVIETTDSKRKAFALYQEILAQNGWVLDMNRYSDSETGNLENEKLWGIMNWNKDNLTLTIIIPSDKYTKSNTTNIDFNLIK